MQPPVDIAELAPAVARICDSSAPPGLRQMAATGIAPGLKPADALTVIAILSECADEALATTALATLGKIPAPLLNGALAGDLPPGVLALLGPYYAFDAVVMEKMLQHAAMPPEAVADIAMIASESVAELIATNEERLLAHPEIIEKLYMNKSTRMSTADRVLELAVRNNIELPGIPAYKEAAAAIGNELIAEPSPERNPDDILFHETDAAANEAPLDPTCEDTHRRDEETGDEVLEDKFLPLYARLGRMTIPQRIRRAMLGTSAERLLLVRDTNRLVAQAAVKSPALQESEVARISLSRNVSEDVLRTIALDREWTRSHQIKFNLVSNPRTPFAFSSKLLLYLRDHELKALAKSKNVSSGVAKAAKQQLSRRNPKA